MALVKRYPMTIVPHSSVPRAHRAPPPSGSGPRERPETALTARWSPSVLTVTIVVLAFFGLSAGLYPMTAQWVNSYNQSQIISDFTGSLATLDPSVERQLALAQTYNEALTSGALLQANSSVPQGDGVLDDDAPDYWQMLRGGETGIMGRVRIDSIGVDLPIFHGTGEDSLLRGAGHLEGSHLPIGGDTRHTVITAHRGLANAAMFTRLDEVKQGDTFTLEVLDEVLTYRVTQTKVVNPEDTDTIRPEVGRDLATLVTCTPLGINTHRILVTGERITPTPEKDIVAAGKAPDVPGFPWWGVWGVLGLGLITVYLVRSGWADAKARRKRPRARHAVADDQNTELHRQGERGQGI